jgi:hypothetical protein
MIEQRPLGTASLLSDAAARAAAYLESARGRRVAPPDAAVAALRELDGVLPDHPTAPADVLALLDRVASPATVTSTGGRYFGFVTGGALPASTAAAVLAAGWDQNASLRCA